MMIAFMDTLAEKYASVVWISSKSKTTHEKSFCVNISLFF